MNTRIPQNIASTKLWTAVILLAVFLIMLFFNWMTPLISDDYTYLMLYPTTARVESLGDLVLSQYNHYMQWGGRTLSIGLNQLFLLLGKWLFNILNSLVFCFVVWACAKLASGHQPVSPLLVFISLGMLIHMNPGFGGVNLWMCGSCVYLWPLFFLTVFLLPYRLALDNHDHYSRLFPLWMLLAGVAAGWGNENTSGAALLVSLVFIVLLRIFTGRFYVWTFTGFAGCLSGFLLLILSPGQWVRMGTVPKDPRPPLSILATRIINATHTLWLYGAPLLLLLGVLYFSLWAMHASPLQLTMPAAFLVLALAANYALILSPVYYIRSYYPVLFFIAAAVLSCLASLFKLTKYHPKLLQSMLSGLFCVFLCIDFIYGGYDIISYRTMRLNRDAEIVAAAQSGLSNIETYAVFPYTRFCGAWGQPDIRKDPHNWVNKNMAQHLHVDSITAVEQHYYPFPGYDDFSNTVETQLSLSLE